MTNDERAKVLDYAIDELRSVWQAMLNNGLHPHDGGTLLPQQSVIYSVRSALDRYERAYANFCRK